MDECTLSDRTQPNRAQRTHDASERRGPRAGFDGHQRSAGSIPLIAGNRVVHRLERLREFWAHFETRLPEPWSQLKALLTGVRGFYHLNPAVAWGVETRVRVGHSELTVGTRLSGVGTG